MKMLICQNYSGLRLPGTSANISSKWKDSFFVILTSKEGKKISSVDVPQEALMSIFETDE